MDSKIIFAHLFTIVNKCVELHHMPFVSFAKKNKLNKGPDKKYHWTFHVQDKMRYYNLSPSLVKRVIRYPARIEEGVAPKTTAVMRPAETKKYQEIWVMYQRKLKIKNEKCKIADKGGQIKIISAWRYPGKSPEHNPIPKDILEEVRGLLNL